MDDELQKMIREARRTLRRASGIPLTPSEQWEERRNTALETMEMFVYDKLRSRGMFALRASVVWTEEGAAARFIANGKTFFVREVETNYRLTTSEKEGEQELVRLDAADPQFCNKVLVAIGDTIGW